MKRVNILLTVAVIGLFVFSMCTPVRAQSQTTLISLHPMSVEVRAALETWLATSAPVEAPYYAVTYIEQSGFDFFVSLAALNLSSPDEEWHFVEEGSTPSKVLWIGSVKVLANSTIQPLFEPVAHAPRLAKLREAGGGSHVLFPFDAGSFVIYGPRAVHGSGDYGTTGMVAVDLVSGDDMGGSAASAAVYASDSGTVDYVCDDGTTTAIRTHNTGTGDYFVYAHMLDNANLSMSHEFAQREYIGALKYGTFDDTCGWAEQANDHYHNHWMFAPASGSFRAEGCILSTSTQKWTCGTQTVGVGGKLFGGGGTNGGIDDPGGDGGTNQEAGFWDGMLIAFVTIFDQGAMKLLPQHNSPTVMLFGILNMVRIFFRLVWTLTKFNLNLGPVMALVFVAIASKLMFGVIWVVFAILRTVKAIPGA
jgi:hypothetical protein